MKTTERFDNAVTKLYNAFHNGTLNAMDCKMCAVGNLCNNSDSWVGSWNFGEEERIRESFINNTGYSRQELSNIELIFIEGRLNQDDPMVFNNSISNTEVANGMSTKKEQRELQFLGLCAVVEYLCELDNIPNVMDYTKLFETENDKPKYQLS